MPDQVQYAIQDRNRIPGKLVHSGTSNAATLIRATGQTDGSDNVFVTGGTVVTGSGTQAISGTIDRVNTVGTLALGTITRLEGGTLGILSQGSVNVTAGTVVVNSATISVLPNLPQGSVNVTAGTITAGTLNNLVSGTINSATAVINSATISVLPNLPQGSINVTAGTVAVSLGTVGGKAASGAAAVANPVLTAGTDAGGTVYAPLMTTTGHQLVDILSGSIAVTAGTIAAHAITAATITAGTINTGTVNAGTIDLVKAGTITKLEGGTLGILSQGSINVTAGTITAGTLTNLTSGTINSATVVLNSGTISVLPNLPQGSINVTAGTITHGTIDAGTFALLPLAGSAFGTSVAVGTTATALPASALTSRKSMIFYNLGTSRIWLTGASGVGSTGIPVGTADYSPPIDVGTTLLYGVADTAGGTVTTLEIS